MKLSIIILSWNTSAITKQTLESVYRETKNISAPGGPALGWDFEVILIDNNSADDSVAMIKRDFPRVVLVENKDNLGFAKGNNQGMAIAKGEYTMLLNSDTIVLDGAINKLAGYLNDHPEVMMVGPRLLNKDGTFQHACRRVLPDPVNSFFYLFGLNKIFKRSKIASEYKQLAADPEISGPAQALSGAAMMFRRTVYEKIGGLDERFFMYGEDLDFCKRVYDNGWITMYLADAKITHLGGVSSGKRRTKSLINFYDAMWLYYKKHFGKKNNFLINTVIWLGIKLRMSVALVINLFK